VDAAPRLPLLGESPLREPNRAAIDAARKRYLDRLRRRVAGIARGVLLNPAPAIALMNGDDPRESDASLLFVVKAICRRKRVIGYEDVVVPMCISERFKFRHPDVIAGRAPRPRDLARRSR